MLIEKLEGRRLCDMTAGLTNGGTTLTLTSDGDGDTITIAVQYDEVYFYETGGTAISGWETGIAALVVNMGYGADHVTVEIVGDYPMGITINTGPDDPDDPGSQSDPSDGVDTVHFDGLGYETSTNILTGAAKDYVFITDAPGDVNVDLGYGPDELTAYSDCENLDAYGDGGYFAGVYDNDDELDASACTTKVNLYGMSGGDTLKGGDGDDILSGDSGWYSGFNGDPYDDADTFDGGAGDDTIYASDYSRWETIEGGAHFQGDTVYLDAPWSALLSAYDPEAQSGCETVNQNHYTP